MEAIRTMTHGERPSLGQRIATTLVHHGIIGWPQQPVVASLIDNALAESGPDIETIREAVVALNEIADALETTNKPRAIQLRATAFVIGHSLPSAPDQPPRSPEDE